MAFFFFDRGRLEFSSFSFGTFTMAFMKVSKSMPFDDIASDLGMNLCYPRRFALGNG